MITAEAIDKLTALAHSGAVLNIEGYPAVALPPNFNLKVMTDVVAPRFVKQRVDLHTIRSFADYVNMFGTPGTQVFAHITDSALKLVAVIDYHRLTANDLKPERCSHIATFETRRSSSWNLLLELAGKPMNQEKFAEFIEDNLRLFPSMPAAGLLELVNNLSGSLDVSFSEVRRLADGRVSLNYVEQLDIKGSHGTGKMELPRTLTMAVQPFDGEPPYQLEVRLKIRLVNRRVEFVMEPLRMADAARDAAKIMLASLESMLGKEDGPPAHGGIAILMGVVAL